VKKKFIKGEIGGKGGILPQPQRKIEVNNREKAREVYCPQDY